MARQHRRGDIFTEEISFIAFSPSTVVGVLTKTCSDQARISRASLIIPGASVLSTSALTGPCTTSTILSVLALRSAVQQLTDS